MREEVQSWLSQLVDEHTKNAREVGEVFTDYFGENLVDVKAITVESFTTAYRDLCLGDVVPHSLDENDNVVVAGKTLSPREWNRLNQSPVFEVLDENYFEAAKDRLQRRFRSFLAGHPFVIIVRFPHVTVTNENDASIDITELYAKIPVAESGTLLNDFRLFRAEYTVAQYTSGYAHSHLPGTELAWQHPCLGSGPIRTTQNFLKNSFDLDRWGLFCYELSKYVTVESISGVPYKRLEDVGMNVGSIIDYPYYRVGSLSSYADTLKNFSAYYIRTQPIEFAFVNGIYQLGCDPIDFLINVTRCFIDWYNKRTPFSRLSRRFDVPELKNRNILVDYVIQNRQLYWPGRNCNLNNLHRLQGTELFEFKGQMVRLNFIDLESEHTESSVVTLLNHDFVCALMSHIMKVINYKYGYKETNTNSENTSNKKHCII